MAEPTLVQLFGPGATQTATNLTLTKADFTAVGLTANANNSSESLLLAIIKRARLNQDTDTATTQLAIGAPILSTVQRGSINVTRYRYSVDVYVTDTNPTEPSPNAI